MPIKLIAADMDGTLLDSQKRLPAGLDALIHALYAQGVRFAPASGRQYYTLYEQFRDSFGAVADELIYISENGAMVCDGAKLLSFDAMPADEVCRAVEAVRRMPGVYTIVSAQDGGVYEQGDDAAFQEKSRNRMMELMSGGTTVMFVSHSLPQIREMCSRVVWLEQGKVRMFGETQAVCDAYEAS